MKQKFGVGAELDILTPNELEKSISPIRQRILQPPVKRKRTTQVTTDASGNLGGGKNGIGASIYRANLGMRADILRLAISSQLYTPASPLTSGWINVCVDSGANPPDAFFPGSGTTVLPALYTDGESALVINGGERLMLVGASLPVNFTITVRLLVREWPDVQRMPGEGSR